jgi:putative transposase
MSRSADATLTVSAHKQAIALRAPSPGLIVHSDRGSQYASRALRQLLGKHRLLQSMSRKGNCYDNAPTESFLQSLKAEEIRRQIYDTHEQAVRAVADYIERFYNPERLYSTLKYASPVKFENSLEHQAA